MDGCIGDTSDMTVIGVKIVENNPSSKANG
jgi:hypothetical protein